MGCYSVTERNEVLLFAAIRVTRNVYIMLHEICLAQKYVPHNFTHLWEPERTHKIRTPLK